MTRHTILHRYSICDDSESYRTQDHLSRDLQLLASVRAIDFSWFDHELSD